MIHIAPDTPNDAFSTSSWWGHYVHGAKRFYMDLHVWCVDGRLRGDGVDTIGAFLLDGSFTPSSGKVSWTKQYLGRHSIQYVGLAQPAQGIWGYWAIDTLFGEFHIWPQTETNPGPQSEHTNGFALRWVELLRHYRAKGDTKACEAACAKVIATANWQNADELNSIAWSLYELDGDLRSSERLARTSLTIAPHNAYAAHTLVSILIRQEKWDETWPILRVWLVHVADWIVEERWQTHYLPLFREIFRAGWGPAAAAVLKTVERDQLWTPLYDALLTKDENNLKALKFMSLPCQPPTSPPPSAGNARTASSGRNPR